MPETPLAMTPPRPPKRPGSPPFQPHPNRREIEEALWETDEPIASIAARLGISKQSTYVIYARLCRERGGPPPQRRTDRDIARAADTQPTVGDRIAEARLARGLSQKALAAMLDPPAPQSSVGKAEIAGDAVSPEFVARVAAALGIDPCDLDIRLAPADALTIARVDAPGKGVGWEPLRDADRARMDRVWEGDRPATRDLGKLVDAAAAAAVPVVIRSDLGVRAEGGGEGMGNRK